MERIPTRDLPYDNTLMKNGEKHAHKGEGGEKNILLDAGLCV